MGREITHYNDIERKLSGGCAASGTNWIASPQVNRRLQDLQDCFWGIYSCATL